MLSLDIVLVCEGFKSAIEVWRKLNFNIDWIKGETIEDEYTEKKVSLQDLDNYLSSNNRNSFSFATSDGFIRYFNSASDGKSRGRIMIQDVLESESQIDLVLYNLLDDASFVQARLYDSEYEHVQNLKSFRQYKKTGGDPSKVVLVSNGLPPPLEEMEIDISGNPGRTILMDGYIEFLGSLMWFSERFWELVGDERRKKLLSSPFNVSPVNGTDKVRVSETLFKSSRGEEENIQNDLRALLYGDY